MKNNYSLGEIIKNSISMIYTKLFFKGARLIRCPIYVRGKKLFKYGEGLTTGYRCRFEIFEDNENTKKLFIGKNCRLGDNVHIAAGKHVKIGNDVLIASKVYISDISHGTYNSNYEKFNLGIAPNERKLFYEDVIIGDRVWLGENVCVLQGVHIGDNCIIGANAVVNKDIPNNSIAVGVPAKVIKKYNTKSNLWERV